MSSLRVLCGICVVIFLMSESWAQRGKFADPLDTPAAVSTRATKGNLVGVAHAGKRLVAVGQMGHILYSDDNGLAWQQADVPVSSDLVAVQFPSDKQGWAVGHDGVVLHSADAGVSWQQQMSGRQLADIAQKFYSARASAGDEQAAQQLERVQQLVESAPSFSFLDVWFRNDQEGYAVGAFNLIFKTADGGTSWQPWFERTDNPSSYHLYAVRGDADGVYIVGELGLLLRLDEQAQRFVALESPYQGSFFGALVNGSRVIAYGLRGNVFESTDAGKTWDKLSNPSDDSLTAGVWLKNGDALLLSQSGELLRAALNKSGLVKLAVGRGYPSNAAAITEQEDALAIVGPWGVKQLSLN